MGQIGKYDVSALSCEAIQMEPVHVDWDELRGTSGWQAYEAFTCERCKRIAVCDGIGEFTCSDVTPEVTELIDGEEIEVPNTCDGTLYAEGPMMSYAYPVSLNECADAARRIAHLPLCVVEFGDGRTALALTGGGMDLSWEICEAFIALGFYPPVHFCDLPRMGRRGTSDDDRQIIHACRESCRILGGWLDDRRKRLLQLTEI